MTRVWHQVRAIRCHQGLPYHRPWFLERCTRKRHGPPHEPLPIFLPHPAHHPGRSHLPAWIQDCLSVPVRGWAHDLWLPPPVSFRGLHLVRTTIGQLCDRLHLLTSTSCRRICAIVNMVFLSREMHLHHLPIRPADRYAGFRPIWVTQASRDWPIPQAAQDRSSHGYRANLCQEGRALRCPSLLFLHSQDNGKVWIRIALVELLVSEKDSRQRPDEP